MVYVLGVLLAIYLYKWNTNVIVVIVMYVSVLGLYLILKEI